MMSNIYNHFIPVVKLVFCLALLFFASTTLAASLSLTPSTGVYTTGQAFTARVVVNTGGASINASDGTIKFNPNELSVVSISKGSIFNLWTAEPTFSNSAGTIKFSGGTPSGYKGSAGTVINVTFRTKGAGTSKLNFTSGSVLAADGLGTNVLTGMTGASYTISATTEVPKPEVIIEYVPPANTPDKPVISSDTHNDPDGWYSSNVAELTWELPSDVTAVRTLLDANPSSVPSKVYDNPIDSITLEDLEEGKQYFHLQFKNSDGWGTINHYRLAVDTKPPTLFELSLPESADLSNPIQTIISKVEDDTSDVLLYKVQINGKEPIFYEDEFASSTIVLNGLEPGYHNLVVEALDQAGNGLTTTFSLTILAFDKPAFTEYPTEINEEVIPVIKGITRPDSDVFVTVSQVGLGISAANAVKTYTVASDADGQFIFIPEGTFSLGVYELTAEAVDKHGAKSDLSDPVRIAVQKPGYLKLGSLALNVLSVFVPLLGLLALCVLLIWFTVLRFRRMRSSVQKEAGEASAILLSEFSALEGSLEEHKKTLTKSRKTKKLTKAEASVLGAISVALKESRARVEKEIEDVEDIVD